MGKRLTGASCADALTQVILQILPAEPAAPKANNFTIKVAGSSDGYSKVTTIYDVAFGDVILCSGEDAATAVETSPHAGLLFLQDSPIW